MMHGEVPGGPRLPDKVSPGSLARTAGNIIGQLQYISTYGSPAVAVGAISACAAAIAGRPMFESSLWMFFGIALYLPFLSYYLRPQKIVERNFKLWDRWVERGIITSHQSKEWRRELHAWYKDQLFQALSRDGNLPPLISDPTTRAKTR
jgi:hypothetical protein